MKFNKKVLALLIVLICSIALIGCSKSSSGGSSSAGTLSVTVKDSGGTVLSGVVMHYVDPNGVSKTATSSSQGKMAITIDPAGNYTINSFTYPLGGGLTMVVNNPGSALYLPAISANLLIQFGPAILYTPVITLSY